MLKVLVYPGWFPTPEYPHRVPFIREHVRTAALHADVVIAYGEPVASNEHIHGAFRRLSDTREEGLRTIRYHYSRGLAHLGLLAQARALHALIRRLRREGFAPDLVHAHVYFAGLIAALACKPLGMALVVTEHSSSIFDEALDWRRRLYARFGFGWADAVIPVSLVLQRSIEALGLRARFHVIPNPVDTELFSPLFSETGATEPDALRSPSPGGMERTVRIVSVGHLIPAKGWLELFEALAIARKEGHPLTLDAVGDGPDRGRFERRCRELGLGKDIVQFHGSLERPALAHLMKRSDFLVSASHRESFGLTPAEALACGRPVVVTRSGGPQEFVVPKVGITVPPRDAIALARGLIEMRARLHTFDTWDLAGYARERFSREAVGRRLCDLYNDVAG